MDSLGSDGSDSLGLYASQEYQYGDERREKTFNDNVHGHITLHRASVAIIDTPQFQRLRNLKQLGLTYYIYPGASHNRFEHSLGVAHLATQWGKHLIGNRGGPSDDGWNLTNFTREDRHNFIILQLAGLCHDLGHGPFSHVFEKELLPKLFPGQDEFVKQWHHETMSNKIFDHIIADADNGIDLGDLAGLGSDDVKLIKELMHGSKNPRAAYASAPWLFDIVANKRNGIDVDKFDYLLRDSKMCGVAVQLDPQRLMMLSRLDRDKEQVIFKMTEYGNIATGLFQSRAEMHRRVYTHQKVKAIEYMVCEALALAAEPLGLREAVAETADIDLYTTLDDSLLPRLQAMRLDEANEHYAAVKQAQDLLRQMARRQLYKYAQEVTISSTASRYYTGLPTAEEIIGYQSSAENDGVQLRADDVIVCEIRIDQGMKEANPMNTVLFYQTREATTGDMSFPMDQTDVSSMLGTVYQDKKIRVYSKNRDPKVVKALKYAFDKWCNAKLKTQPPGTPWRKCSQQQQQQAAQMLASSSVRGRSRVSFGQLPGSSDAEPPAAAVATGDGTAVAQLFSDAAAADGSSQEQPDHRVMQVPSRKRSLSQQMKSASNGSQQQQNGSQQQQQQVEGAQACQGDMDVDAAAARPAKQSRSSGARRGLPGIAEEAAEGC